MAGDGEDRIGIMKVMMKTSHDKFFHTFNARLGSHTVGDSLDVEVTKGLAVLFPNLTLANHIHKSVGISAPWLGPIWHWFSEGVPKLTQAGSEPFSDVIGTLLLLH